MPNHVHQRYSVVSDLHLGYMHAFGGSNGSARLKFKPALKFKSPLALKSGCSQHFPGSGLLNPPLGQRPPAGVGVLGAGAGAGAVQVDQHL